MKKFSIAFIVVMLFCFAPVLVYAGPLDAETAEQGTWSFRNKRY